MLLDITILFQTGGRSLPLVVSEVGFSETYDDLRNDAHQWLSRSSGRVRLVILIKIEEGTRLLEVHRRKQESLPSFQKYGNDLGKLRAGIKSETSEESDTEVYNGIYSEIRQTDWVGPIMGIIRSLGDAKWPT